MMNKEIRKIYIPLRTEDPNNNNYTIKALKKICNITVLLSLNGIKVSYG